MADDTLRIDRSAKTLRTLALERMREAIMDFHFQPGERLVERPLCDQLGVSRSVVREVLRQLEAEGLVQMVPGHGPAVAKPDLGRTDEIYELRALLE
ncbi:MAG: GntR family transcriptional regulator, partial [Mesorhizobium sp.]